MSKETLYLKFRPFQLEDVIGQKHTTGTLKQASIANKFAHAYLFSGNRGCGKTTTARILANLLNCDNPKDGRVCGECRACKTIRDGVAMDVVELDGAANGNVENVQSLIEGANWSPSELKRKVYIIYECHCISSKAISALLKIVEEPPEYLVFVFCTTEPKKIPGTILSRAQRFNFRKISSKEIVGRLSYIAKQENIPITEGALFEIAKLSRGCLRDAIVPLEQIATIAAKKEVTEMAIQKYFGLPDR